MAFKKGREGWYKANITLDGNKVGNELTIIVLTQDEKSKVNSAIRKFEAQSNIEADLVSENGTALTKPKTIYCSLTSKQLTIKEYYFRFFPRRLYTFR